jgi:hypothetical protein
MAQRCAPRVCLSAYEHVILSRKDLSLRVEVSPKQWQRIWYIYLGDVSTSLNMTVRTSTSTTASG